MPINLRVGSEFDEDAARRAAREAEDYYKQQAVKLKVEAKLAEESARKASGDAQKILEANAAKLRVDAELKNDAAREVMRQFNAELKAQKKPTIEVETKIDRDVMGKAFNVLTDDATKAGSKAGQGWFSAFLADLGTALPGGLQGQGGAVVFAAMVPAATALAGVAASAAEAINLVPAAAGAAAGALVTLKIATMGVSDAIGAMSDPKKFAEALQAISPQAQQAVMALKNLMPAFEQLKNATQDALFSGIGPQLTRLAGQYMPAIQGMTTGIAGAFNQMMQGVANSLATPQMQGSLQTFMNNVVASFRELAPAIAPLSRALADFMAVGSGFLPELARGATQAALAFSQFINNARQSGDLKRWIGEGLDTIKQLFPAVMELAKAFLSLAPIGRQMLPEIVKAIEGMSKAIEVGAGLVNTLTEHYVGLFGAIRLVGGAVELVSKAFDLIPGVIKAMANTAIPVINQITQALNYLTEPIRRVLGIVGMSIPDIPQIPQISSAVGGNGTPTVNRTSRPDANTLFPGGADIPLPGGASTQVGNSLGVQSAGSAWGSGGGGPLFTGNFPTPKSSGGGGSGGGSGSSGGSGTQANKFTGPMGTEEQFNQIAQFAAQFGLVMISGKRGYDPTHPSSFHTSGEAGDFGMPGGGVDTPQMLAFAEFMRQNFGNQLDEEIYSGPGFSGQMIGHGKTVPDSYYGSELAAHHNHVHIAAKDPLQNQGFGPNGPSDPTKVKVEEFGTSATQTLNGVFQPLAEDMGLSGGLPGVVKFLVTLMGNMALAGAIGGGAFGGPAATAAALGVGGQGQQQSAGVSQAAGPAPNWSADWNAIAQKESGGNWGIDTGNGYKGGLQFAPGSWTAAGGQQYAPAANQATPYEQTLTAEELLKQQGRGAWPNTFTPGSSGPAPSGPGAGAGGNWGGMGLPNIPAGSGGGNSFMGMGAGAGGPGVGAGVGAAGPQMQGHAQGDGGWQPQGGGAAGLGGAPMEAIDAAAGMVPGVGQAAQVGMKLANRAIGFAGQAAAIGVEGLFQTFLPGGGENGGDPLKSWPGKIIAGFAGARPAQENKAGKSAPPSKQVDPNTTQHGTGGGQPPGPLIGTMNVTSPSDSQQIASDVDRQNRAYGAGQPR